MKLFLFLLMQSLLFLPMASMAAERGEGPITENHNKAEFREIQKARATEAYGRLPLYFVKNQGQTDKAVKFYEKGAGHATFFTKDGVVLALTKDSNDKKPATETVTLSFAGTNSKAEIRAEDKKTGHVNYLVGDNKSEWRSNIPTYGAITYKNVYKNIDIKFYGTNRDIEHDIIVRPGGDFSKVIFAYRGIKGLKVTGAGDLEVSLNHGNIIEGKPLIYQEINGKRVVVDGSYRILGSKDGSFTYGYTLASYDHSKKIVIDPVLSYSTYLGGNLDDVGIDIAVDSAGNAYVTGNTLSLNFPLASALQASNAGITDVFVTKINPTGTALVYSTYLGGASFDTGNSIVVDAAGNVFITGDTLSTDFPLASPIQAANSGSYDAFITELNPTGSALVYSTYLGGTTHDSGAAIALDTAGNAYVTGKTDSADFPTASPAQAANAGGFDIFVAKINAAGSAIVYSTYLGGALDDNGNGIALDAVDNAYVTGDTSSVDFPVVGPIQAANGGGGGVDAFVTEVNAAGTAFVYSTYLGGTSTESGSGIAVDASGNAYVTGHTASSDFPTASPIQASNAGAGSFDVFVAKINVGGTALVYSTYLGGSSHDFGSGIALDAAGNAYVTGDTVSADFPLTSPIQASNAGLSDVFITEINSAGTALLFSTYLGGSSSDFSRVGIALDPAGSAYVTGETSSLDFPALLPIQATNGGGRDVFIAKVGPAVTMVIVPDVPVIMPGQALGYTVTATNSTGTEQCFQYWENLNIPGGALFPAKGSLLRPVPRLCLSAWASQSAHLTHSVSPAAPLGTYIFNAYAGIFPSPVQDVVYSAHFNFDVGFTPVRPANKR